MDEIEAGFNRITEKIRHAQEQQQEYAETIRANDALLLDRMAAAAAPVVNSMGIALLEKGKQANDGELYDTRYYDKKMIIIGKSEPSPVRPDNPAKRVIDQFCLLGEDGKFYEVMYSNDGFVTDSYLNPLDGKAVLEIYGYDVMFMLYKAMLDCLAGEERLIAALEATIAFVFEKK